MRKYGRPICDENVDPHACDACLDSTVDVSRSRRRFRLQAQIADLVPSVNHAALPYPQGDRLEVVLRGIGGSVWMQFAFAIVVVRVIVWLIARFIGYLWRRRGRDPVSLVIDRGWIDVEGTLQSSRFVAAGGHWAHGSGPKTPLMAISVDVTTNYLIGWVMNNVDRRSNCKESAQTTLGLRTSGGETISCQPGCSTCRSCRVLHAIVARPPTHPDPDGAVERHRRRTASSDVK